MFCFRSNSKGTKSKPFASIYKFFYYIGTFHFASDNFLDQIKLVRFVPEPMGQNGNKLLLIQKNSDQTKTFCFRSDLKRTKSKRFAFVPILRGPNQYVLLRSISFWIKRKRPTLPRTFSRPNQIALLRPRIFRPKRKGFACTLLILI